MRKLVGELLNELVGIVGELLEVLLSELTNLTRVTVEVVGHSI